MNIYIFKATALCPARDTHVRDFYECKLVTDVTIPVSDIAEICEEFVNEKLFQEKFTTDLKRELPRGELTVTGSHFGIELVSVRTD
jgi:hypothetical protein